MTAPRSIDELNEIGERVRRAVEDWPGATMRWSRVDEDDGGFVSVRVEATDFARLAAALVRRFGDAVDVRRVEFRERAHPFGAWWLDEATLELTVQCTGGRDDAAWRLELVESRERVEATVIVGSYVLTTESTRPNRPGARRRGRNLLGYAGEARAQLSAPLGDREVIDTFLGVTRSRYPTPKELEREPVAVLLGFVRGERPVSALTEIGIAFVETATEARVTELPDLGVVCPSPMDFAEGLVALAGMPDRLRRWANLILCIDSISVESICIGSHPEFILQALWDASFQDEISADTLARARRLIDG